MKYFANLLFVVIFLSDAFAQEGDAAFRKKIDWLEKKLSFTYYNVDQAMWWINTFTYNEESGICKYRSISSKNPAKLVGKKYTERTFRFGDLNPYLITVAPVNENQGMIVKGKLIRLETIKHEALIGKTINGVAGTSQSYIHFSIPKYLEDSVASLTDSIALVLKTLAMSATDLTRSDNEAKNRQAIFEAMTGEFSVGEIKRFAESRREGLIFFEEYKNRVKVAEGYFGFDPVRMQYYQVVIGESGQMTYDFYTLDNTVSGLVLISMANPSNKIRLENRSLFVYEINGQAKEYRPSRSF